jgi:phosphatidylglycerol:prolipoprotein diacylglycerol transferase
MPLEIRIDPVAFHVGGLAVHWYGIIVLLAAAAAVAVVLREARRLGIARDAAEDAVIWVALAAMIGGRALYIVQNQLEQVARDPLSALMIWEGGLSFYGAVIGALVALAVFARRHGLRLAPLADAAAPAAALGQGIGHFGCLISGDSFGLPTSLPWAVIYRSPAAMAPQNVPLHPTQLYEAAALLLLFAGLWLARRWLTAFGPWTVTGAYLLGLSVVRFALFFLRDEPSVLFGLKTAQLIGIGIALLAVVLLTAGRSRAYPALATYRQMEANQP